jgi:asparagine synthase (glutamine-hydrolysing)
MCGFAGMLKNSTIIDEDLEVLKKMSKAIWHRGPDEDGIYTYDTLAFAFRRLSIIDLEKGNQPFSWGGGKYTAIFNGEIYNYIELREELIEKGYSFETSSEIEVMLAYYDFEGKDFVKRLRGMFSFLIWDRKQKILVAGRDRFGIKPFYYMEKQDGLFFASEMKAFMYLKPLEIEKNSLQHYMTFQFVPEPDTMDKDIKIVPTGSLMICAPGQKPEFISYVDMRFTPTPSKRDDRIALIRKVMEDSVKYHMRSDVPVGTFLSSGIDSAIITAISSQLNPGIKAFTIGSDVSGYSELDDAAQIASHLNVEHITLKVTAEDFAREFKDVVWHLDSPVADPSAVAIWFITKEAAKHVKVILSGEGADELFGGYLCYGDKRAPKFFAPFPRPIKDFIYMLSQILPDGFKGKAFIRRGCVPLEERYVGNAFIFDEKQKSRFLTDYNKNQSYRDLTSPFFNEVIDESACLKMQYCDLKFWLKGDILVKSDRMSMAHSLELRVPFLDREVFDVAKMLTEEDKISGGTTKRLLREAFKDVVNPETVMRKKLGYPVPVRVWLRNELYDFAKDIITTSNVDEYLDKNFCLKLLEDHRKHKSDNYRKLWTMLTFMEWHKLYIEDAENSKQIHTIDRQRPRRVYE